MKDFIGVLADNEPTTKNMFFDNNDHDVDFPTTVYCSLVDAAEKAIGEMLAAESRLDGIVGVMKELKVSEEVLTESVYFGIISEKMEW